MAFTAFSCSPVNFLDPKVMDSFLISFRSWFSSLVVHRSSHLLMISHRYYCRAGGRQGAERGGGICSLPPHILSELKTKSFPSKDLILMIAPLDFQTFCRIYLIDEPSRQASLQYVLLYNYLSFLCWYYI